MVARTATVAKPAAPANSAKIAEQKSAGLIKALIAKAIKSYGTAKGDVQEAGLAIIEHANKYGDCSQAKVLARGVPARERNSLIGWFRKFSPIGISMGKTPVDDRCRFTRPGSNNYSDFNIAGAKLHPWFTDPDRVNPAPKPLNTLVDFYEGLDKFLKKAIRDAAADQSKYDPQQRADVKAQAETLLRTVNQFRAKTLPKVLEMKVEQDNSRNVIPTAAAA